MAKGNLSQNKFTVSIDRFPNVTMNAQNITIPGVSIGTTSLYTNRSVDLFIVGDKVVFEDFIVSFIVDENMEGYMEILKWIAQAGNSELQTPYSDISVNIYNNNLKSNKTVKLYNTWPWSLSPLSLDTTQDEGSPLTVDVLFKISHFEVV